VLEFGILSTERGRNNTIHRVLCGHAGEAPRPRFKVSFQGLVSGSGTQFATNSHAGLVVPRPSGEFGRIDVLPAPHCHRSLFLTALFGDLKIRIRCNLISALSKFLRALVISPSRPPRSSRGKFLVCTTTQPGAGNWVPCIWYSYRRSPDPVSSALTNTVARKLWISTHTKAPLGMDADVKSVHFLLSHPHSFSEHAVPP
jgi:hypothetical protein